jgi:effector-binding domain-containing protein
MEQIAIQPKLYFYLEGKTTLNQLPEYGDIHVDKVYEEVARTGLEKTGPIEFIYYGATEDKNKEFTLQIAIPVKEPKKDIKADFHFRTASDFKCLAHTYKGSFMEFEKVYENLFEYVWDNSLKPTDEVREVYHSFVSPDSPDNVTEIQIGLQA